MSHSLSSRFKTVLYVTAALLLQGVLARADAPERSFLGDHHDSPVYFELYKKMYFDYEGMSSLRNELLKIWNFVEVDISEFDWAHGGINDKTWWSGIARLTFLLPFIDSKRESDRALARKWFNGWYDAFTPKDRTNHAAHYDPFVSAYRGMVLVYFLKMEERRKNPDGELLEKLRLAIYDHQDFLSHEGNFDSNSNHGMVEAIALIELSRAAPNSTFTKLGMDRVLRIADVSVSSLGAHMEHAVGYHFAFLKMLSDIHDYCENISTIQPQRLQQLGDYRDRLQYAAYFLQDHKGILPEIGDSDSLVIGETNGWYRVAKPKHEETVFYDPEAGYAIYKGHPLTRDRRYVVFANQNRPTNLRFHYHDDVLSVFYDYDGEIILGDQGRFEYTESSMRRYFVSQAAHNTIFPGSRLAATGGGNNYIRAEEVGREENDETVSFNAQIRYRLNPLVFVYVDRNVVINRDDKTMCVVDSIWGPIERPKSDSSGRLRIEPGSKRSQAELRRQRQQELAMVWNLGRDVKSVQLEETKADGTVVLKLKTRRGRRFRMSVNYQGNYDSSSLNVKLVRGQISPMLGWYSPTVLNVRSSPTLIITFKPTGEMNIATRVEYLGGKPFPGLGPLLRGY